MLELDSRMRATLHDQLHITYIAVVISRGQNTPSKAFDLLHEEIVLMKLSSVSNNFRDRHGFRARNLLHITADSITRSELTGTVVERISVETNVRRRVQIT